MLWPTCCKLSLARFCGQKKATPVRGGYKGLRRDFVGTVALIAETAFQQNDCDSSWGECISPVYADVSPTRGIFTIFSTTCPEVGPLSGVSMPAGNVISNRAPPCGLLLH